jgi:hypothetical protein
MSGYYSFEVSRLFAQQMRDMLNQMRFKGHPIEWLESGGWFWKTFTVKGPPQSLLQIQRLLVEWNKDTSESTTWAPSN